MHPKFSPPPNRIPELRFASAPESNAYAAAVVKPFYDYVVATLVPNLV